jgi:hypothetical protein
MRRSTTAASGSLPHTARAALTRLRQRGYDVSLADTGTRRAYHLVRPSDPEDHRARRIIRAGDVGGLCRKSGWDIGSAPEAGRNPQR